jgi:hypothetical protein
MKTTRTANDNASATPRLDAVFAGFLTVLSGPARWAIEGWSSHLAATTHQNHAANTWAKHHGEFGTEYVTAVALAHVVARLVDFGMSVEDANELLDARIAARARKAA